LRSALVIAHLYPSVARPASGPFVRDQVAYLAQHFDLDVIAPLRWLPPGRSDWARERAIPVLARPDEDPSIWHPRVPALPGGGLNVESRLWPRFVGDVVRQIRAVKRPGLVHAHFGLPDGYAAIVLAERLGLPVFVTFWGSDALVYSRMRGPRRLLRRVVHAADRLIAVSAGVRDALIELGADAKKVLTIVGGLPSSFNPPDHVKARAQLGVGNDARLLLWAGGFVEVKRPLLVLDAVARAKSEGIQLVMAGTGPLLVPAREHARSLGIANRVRFLGHVDRAPLSVWQSAADVFVNSSDSEGTPFAAMEAISAGTPVVAFHVGGIPDLIARFDAGTCAEGATDAALGEALDIELRSLRSRYRLRRDAEVLREDNALQPLMSLYDEVLR